MPGMQYLDFDLDIERSGDRYRARVIDSPAGQASAEFNLPFTEQDLEIFFLRIGQPRRQVRRDARLGRGSQREIVEQFGGKLYQAAFNDDMRACLRASLDQAQAQGKGLRVRLRLTDAPELADLPWEYLYNPTLNRFLALSVRTSLVRYLDLPERIAPVTVQPPLRMLAMISSPADAPELDVEGEWARLKSALEPLEQRGALAVDRLETPTLSALQRQLRRGVYHIFHYIGHGAFDPQSQDGVLLLEDEARKGRLVSGADLGIMLHDADTLRLVVLNACEGARTSRSDPFAGTAQSLVQQGIPAVVAMQFEITDQAAITFAHEFYAALVDGYAVDGALAEARKAILAQGNDLEWGTPVLHMRTPEGILFRLEEAKPDSGRAAARAPVVMAPKLELDPELERRLDHLYTDALGAYWLQDWVRAVQRLQQVVELRADYRDAATRLQEAERQARLSGLYAQAQEARKAQDWTAVIEPLEALLHEQAGYRDAAALLAEARQQKELADLYVQARELGGAGQWQATLNVLAQIDRLAPTYPDPEGLRAVAERELAEQQRQQRLEDFYRQGIEALGAGRLSEAQGLLRQVQGLQPAYRDTERLLARVQAQLVSREAELTRRNRLEALYREAQGLVREQRWQQALDRLAEIRRLDPAFADPDGLGAAAQEGLAGAPVETPGPTAAQATVAVPTPAPLPAEEPTRTRPPEAGPPVTSEAGPTVKAAASRSSAGQGTAATPIETPTWSLSRRRLLFLPLLAAVAVVILTWLLGVGLAFFLIVPLTIFGLAFTFGPMAGLLGAVGVSVGFLFTYCTGYWCGSAILLFPIAHGLQGLLVGAVARGRRPGSLVLGWLAGMLMAAFAAYIGVSSSDNLKEIVGTSFYALLPNVGYAIAEAWPSSLAMLAAFFVLFSCAIGGLIGLALSLIVARMYRPTGSGQSRS